MLLTAMRGLLAHAFPIFIAQIASVGMMVVDTVVLGHVSPEDLAAVAIGGGIHVSVVFALVGIVQAVAPMVAHLHGARREGEVIEVLQRGLLLALLLSLPGILILRHPGFVMGMAEMDGAVAAKVRDYLSLLAWALPASLCYRTFYAFFNAMGKPRVLMMIGLGALAVHAVLAWSLATGAWAGEALGVLGCAWSNLLIGWVACLAAWLYMLFGPFRHLALFARWHAPRWSVWREMLRLGLPMGFSNLVEITAFTLVALFVAELGASVVAGHRIVANLSALTYMVPLSLGIATMSAVGQALGARDWRVAHANVRAGMVLAGAISSLLGLTLWLAAEPLVATYTDAPEVRAVAFGLIGYVAVYQFFDALQTIAGHVLRAYRITFVPMLLQTFCFWGVGLAGGTWLCYHWHPPMGAAGFWLAAVLSLVFVAATLLPLLRKAMQVTESTP